MATIPNREAKQFATVRRNVVAECYKKGMSLNQTAEFIRVKFNLEKAPGKKTIFTDRQRLLAEWREERLTDMSDMLQLELSRIDDIVMELWAAWEKSKTDHKATFKKQKGTLAGVKPNRIIDRPHLQADPNSIQTTDVERGEKDVIMFGDPRYLAEIRMQLAERRKLLGLYAPEKKELTGKDGSELIPATKYDLAALTPEEKAELLKIARKVERTE